ELYTERIEHARGDALALADQAEQEVLRPDVVVVEADRLVLGEREDPLGAVVEAIERTHERAEATAPRLALDGERRAQRTATRRALSRARRSVLFDRSSLRSRGRVRRTAEKPPSRSPRLPPRPARSWRPRHPSAPSA